MRKHRLRGVDLSVLLCALGAGCIMYVPDSWTRSVREERATTLIPTIIPGQTTKAQVLLTLGEPDEISPDDRRFVYRWYKVKVFGIAPGPPGAVAVGKKYRLILTFDECSVVLQQELENEWGS
jgi:hypothetical protein